MPFVQCYFGAISLLFVPVFGRCLSSGVSSAPCLECSSRYEVGTFLVSDVDVHSLPRLEFQSDIVSIVYRNVVTSFGIALRSQGRFLSLVASLHIYPC